MSSPRPRPIALVRPFASRWRHSGGKPGHREREREREREGDVSWRRSSGVWVYRVRVVARAGSLWAPARAAMRAMSLDARSSCFWGVFPFFLISNSSHVLKLIHGFLCVRARFVFKACSRTAFSLSAHSARARGFGAWRRASWISCACVETAICVCGSAHHRTAEALARRDGNRVGEGEEIWGTKQIKEADACCSILCFVLCMFLFRFELRCTAARAHVEAESTPARLRLTEPLSSLTAQSAQASLRALFAAVTQTPSHTNKRDHSPLRAAFWPGRPLVLRRSCAAQLDASRCIAVLRQRHRTRAVDNPFFLFGWDSATALLVPSRTTRCQGQIL